MLTTLVCPLNAGLRWCEQRNSMESGSLPQRGRSEAIYAHCAGVRLGGCNRYGRPWSKSVAGADQPEQAVHPCILSLTVRLELFWIMLLGLTQ